MRNPFLTGELKSPVAACAPSARTPSFPLSPSTPLHPALGHCDDYDHSGRNNTVEPRHDPPFTQPAAISDKDQSEQIELCQWGCKDRLRTRDTPNPRKKWRQAERGGVSFAPSTFSVRSRKVLSRSPRNPWAIVQPHPHHCGRGHPFAK